MSPQNVPVPQSSNPSNMSCVPTQETLLKQNCRDRGVLFFLTLPSFRVFPSRYKSTQEGSDEETSFPGPVVVGDVDTVVGLGNHPSVSVVSPKIQTIVTFSAGHHRVSRRWLVSTSSGVSTPVLLGASTVTPSCSDLPVYPDP